MTKHQEMQRIIRLYKDKTGNHEVDMHEVARFAVSMGWPLPKPAAPIDLLAGKFSEAAREETRKDNVTKRPYKANHALRKKADDGSQMTIWIDVDEAPRHKMVKALALYRDQMVGEAVIATNTADHWNRINPNQEPLNFETDFTPDVEWSLNAPKEKEEEEEEQPV
jgi:hypothetical protein